MASICLLIGLAASAEGLLMTSRISRPARASSSASDMYRLRGGAPAMEMIGIIVDIEVEPSRVEEFLKVAKADSEGSRAEEGCLRFDVLKSTDSETRFFFYEAYTSAEAVTEHKAQPHFKLWTDFKESGGCTSTSAKASFPEDWGFPK